MAYSFPTARARALVRPALCSLFLPYLFSTAQAQVLNAWADTGQVIAMGNQVAPYLVWNDPSVLAEGTGYRMWLSGGDARDLSKIRISAYQATSPEGRKWTISPTPVLSPGTGGAWDNLRVETPCVVKVGSVYHMYYSGFSEQSAIQGNSQIGHATSLDGVRWTKDLRNPVVTGQSDNQFAWGYGGVGEPGIMYNPNDQLFYLYYTGMRYSPVNSTIGQMGILLAKSSDGSRFEHVTAANGERQAILFRDVPSAINGAWFGYSTPSPAMTSTGEVHLFATFFVGPGGPSTTQGVGIDHAVSPNGVDFAVVEQNILTAGQGDWKNNNVRAPSVIEHGGNLMMWYAGDRTDPYGSGIGFASRPFPY